MKKSLYAFYAILCISPAAAMDEGDAAAKCATAIDKHLRDPDTAHYIWREGVEAGKGDDWAVSLPVRAQNAFGVYGRITFVCSIKGGKVVEVYH